MAEENWDHWDEAFLERDKALGQVVRVAAFNIEGKAKRKAQKDTGFMANSIYAVTEQSSGFAQSKGAAISRRARSFGYRKTKNQERNYQRSLEAVSKTQASYEAAQSLLFSEVAKPEHNEAIVAVGATYGIFPERGTVHQTAKPYLRPSVEAERGPFQSAVKRVVGE